MSRNVVKWPLEGERVKISAALFLLCSPLHNVIMLASTDGLITSQLLLIMNFTVVEEEQDLASWHFKTPLF